MLTIPKPQPGEYAPYAIMYIDQVPEDAQILTYLQQGQKGVAEVIGSLSADKLGVPCAPGEWTVKEILAHIIDQERVFVYRALRFARKDATELQTFDHDAYVVNSDANHRSIESLLEEYNSVRFATLTFFKNLQAESLALKGMVSGNPVSVRALAWIIAGHETHHAASIKQNYLNQ